MGPLGPISVMPVLKNGFWAVWKMLGRDYITDFIFTITSRTSIISISHYYSISCCTGWWFQTCFIFHSIWDNPSHWRTHFLRWLLHHQPVNITVTFWDTPRSSVMIIIIISLWIQTLSEKDHIIYPHLQIHLDPTGPVGSHFAAAQLRPALTKRCSPDARGVNSIPFHRSRVGLLVAGETWEERNGKKGLPGLASLDLGKSPSRMRNDFKNIIFHCWILLTNTGILCLELDLVTYPLMHLLEAINLVVALNPLGWLGQPRCLWSVIIMGHGFGLDACYILNYNCR